MLAREGVVKLSDFGISKQLAATEALAVTQCGTTQYMAPERLNGDSYTSRADVWSVGVMVLEAIDGVHPFPMGRGDSFISLAQKICNGDPPVPSAVDAPGDLRDFVALCLRRPTTGKSARPHVTKLLKTAWMAAYRKSADPAREVEQYLQSLGTEQGWKLPWLLPLADSVDTRSVST